MTDINQRPMTATEWGLLCLLGAVWGGSFFFNAIAVRELPPITFVMLRLALGAAILWAVMAITRTVLPRQREVWLIAVGLGLLNAVLPYTAIVWGQKYIESGTASILNATTPLFTVVVAHLFTRDEKITANGLLGVMFGLVGVAVMIGPDAVAGLTKELPAQLAVVSAGLSYACAGVLGRRYSALGVKPLAAACLQLSCGALLLAPLAVLIDRPWTIDPPGLATWGSVIGIAVLSTAFAYVLLFRVLATAGATNTSLVTLLVPVSAVLLGVVVLGERLAPEHGAGMALIALGLALKDGRLLAVLRGRGRPPRDGDQRPLPADRS